jgi:hypothetical protein
VSRAIRVDQSKALHASHLQHKKREREWAKTQHWVSVKGIKLVSCHLLKSGVNKIHPITPRWNTHTSPWRTTSTTRWRPWSVAPLRPKVTIIQRAKRERRCHGPRTVGWPTRWFARMCVRFSPF